MRVKTTWFCGGDPGPAVSSNGCRFEFKFEYPPAVDGKPNPTVTCPRCGHVDSLVQRTVT